ncbi:CBS domain-containing protein [Desulfovirgula thermocuniculi]|uniref:CBS domain-containing protein n=1 Tax=Desulfovirgula thermocuniculi TaxID=348842 RepID=UPI0004011FA8|nr:CBS domain-containing protein [Desulfovirgula thermocuniculi]
MYGHRTVKEIMVPLYSCPTIREDLSLKEALAVIRTPPNTLLVLDRKQRPVGIVTVQSLFKAVPLFTLSPNGKQTLLKIVRLFHRRKQNGTGTTPSIKDFIWPLTKVNVSSYEPVYNAVLKMLAYRVDSLPVTEDGKVLGMVRATDIFQVIGELLTES